MTKVEFNEEVVAEDDIVKPGDLLRIKDDSSNTNGVVLATLHCGDIILYLLPDFNYWDGVKYPFNTTVSNIQAKQNKGAKVSRYKGTVTLISE